MSIVLVLPVGHTGIGPLVLELQVVLQLCIVQQMGHLGRILVDSSILLLLPLGGQGGDDLLGLRRKGLAIAKHGHPLLPQRLGNQCGPRVGPPVLLCPLAVADHVLCDMQDLIQNLLAPCVVLVALLLLLLVPHLLPFLPLGLRVAHVFLMLAPRDFGRALYLLLVVALAADGVLLLPLGAVPYNDLLPFRLLAQVLRDLPLLLRHPQQLRQHDLLPAFLINVTVILLLVQEHLAPPLLPLLARLAVLDLALLDPPLVLLTVGLSLCERFGRLRGQFLNVLERHLILVSNHLLQLQYGFLSVIAGVLCPLGLGVQPHTRKSGLKLVNLRFLFHLCLRVGEGPVVISVVHQLLLPPVVLGLSFFLGPHVLTVLLAPIVLPVQPGCSLLLVGLAHLLDPNAVGLSKELLLLGLQEGLGCIPLGAFLLESRRGVLGLEAVASASSHRSKLSVA
mmetsp:Transcript_11588/g.20948  ORF Transcript_11588/g.20948 Transcript_11588/m.20948 type:complete len:450 (+) Transcript_11588:3398-4747(+)